LVAAVGAHETQGAFKGLRGRAALLIAVDDAVPAATMTSVGKDAREFRPNVHRESTPPEDVDKEKTIDKWLGNVKPESTPPDVLQHVADGVFPVWRMTWASFTLVLVSCLVYLLIAKLYHNHKKSRSTQKDIISFTSPVLATSTTTCWTLV